MHLAWEFYLLSYMKGHRPYGEQFYFICFFAKFHVSLHMSSISRVATQPNSFKQLCAGKHGKSLAGGDCGPDIFDWNGGGPCFLYSIAAKIIQNVSHKEIAASASGGHMDESGGTTK